MGDCLDLFHEIKSSNGALDEFNTAVSAHGFHSNKKTSVVGKIVKLVFAAERRRSSVYSIVLAAAYKAGKKGSDLPGWIRAAGGIEEIRLSQSKGKDTPSKQVLLKEGNDAVMRQEILGDGIVVPASCKLADSESTPLSVAILKRRADGSRVLVWAVSDNALVKSALMRFGASVYNAKDAEARATAVRKRSSSIAKAASMAKPIKPRNTTLKIQSSAPKPKTTRLVVQAA